MTAPPGVVAANKALVARAVAEVINGGNLDAVDEPHAPGIAQAATDGVAPFRAAVRGLSASRP